MYERQPTCIWWNGSVADWASATVHVTSEVATRGTNVFEGVRAYWRPDEQRHDLLFRDRHLERLAASARMIGLPPKASASAVDELREGCDALVRALGPGIDLYLRPTIYIDQGRYGWLDEDTKLGTYVAGYEADPAGLRPLRCVVSSWQRTPELSISPLAKVGAAYQAFRLPRIEAARAGKDEAIVLTCDGMIAETGGAAVFLLHRGRVWTPPLSEGVLDGVTRDTVLRLLAAEGVHEVIREPVPRSMLYAADEVFVCGTMDEIRPVVEVDDRLLDVGPLATRLYDRYLELCHGGRPLGVDGELHPVRPAREFCSVAEPGQTTSDRWSFQVETSARLARRGGPVEARLPGRAEPGAVSAVMFDIGLTLIHPSGAVIAEELAAATGEPGILPPTELVAAFTAATEARHAPFPAGVTDEQRVSRTFGHYLGLGPAESDAAWARLLARTDLYRELDPDAVAVLSWLRSHGFVVGAVSNSDGTLAEELHHFGLEEHFDTVVDSTLAGSEKPASAIYRAAAWEMGHPPASCLFVGDGPINDVWGSLQAGIGSAVLYDRYDIYPGRVTVPRIHELRDLRGLLTPSEGDTGGDR